MPLYIGVNGVVKEVKELTIAGGGVLKKAKNGYSGDFYNTIDKNGIHDNNIHIYFGSEWAKEMTLTVYPIVLNGLTYDVTF